MFHNYVVGVVSRKQHISYNKILTAICCSFFTSLIRTKSAVGLLSSTNALHSGLALGSAGTGLVFKLLTVLHGLYLEALCGSRWFVFGLRLWLFVNRSLLMNASH
jgi:hypothetical protein